MLTVEQGRPKEKVGRSEKEIAVYDYLDRLSISYERVDHGEARHMEDCFLAEEALQIPVYKNLLLCNRQQTAFYLLIMPGEKPFKTKDLSNQIGSARLSFASPEWMDRLLHVSPGSLSILALMHDQEQKVSLLLDAEVLQNPSFGCHPCVNTSSLKLKTQDLLQIFLPQTGHFPKIVHL